MHSCGSVEITIQIRARLTILMLIQIRIRILPQVLHMPENLKIVGTLIQKV
jgi:hypothetical protein